MATTNGGEGRASYLLDGHRITVSDLINAGLLDVGTELTFERKRIGSRHRATVTPKGLRIEGGEEFSSPSRAAVIAAGVRAMDGWHAWAVGGSGRTLAVLRDELLDGIASEPTDPATVEDRAATPTTQERHDFLKRARVACQPDGTTGLP